MVTFGLAFEPPFDDEDAELERAVELARDADVAIVVVGTTAEVESEGFDRSSLALPGPPGRARPARQRRAAADGRRRQRGRAGAAAVAGRGARGAALLVPGPGGGQRARRRPVRRRRARRAAADHVAGVARTACPRSPRRRRARVRRGTGDRLPRADASRCCRSATGSATRRWEYLAMDGADRAAVQHRHAPRARGRPGLRVAPGQRGRAAAALARRLRRRSRPTRARRSSIDVPLSPRAFQHWDGGWQTEPGEFVLEAGRSVADLRVHRAHGAEAARVLRGGRAPPALHARRGGALRHPAGALAADPAAGGGARADAAAADVARRRADRGGRGPARARRGGARRGGARRGRTWTATRASRAGSCGSRRPRPTRRGCRRRSRTSTAITRASRSGCARARPRRSSRWSQAGTVDVAVLALTEEPRASRSTPLADEPLRVAVPLDDELAAPTVTLDDLRGRPFILAEPGTALRETVMARGSGRPGSARCRCSRSATR